MIARFGTVGLGAARVHAAWFMLLVERFGLSGTAATPIAFLRAFLVSYVGQSQSTFGAPYNPLHFARHGLRALLGLGLNILAARTIVDIGREPSILVLPFAVGVVPAARFVLMRVWAFPPVPVGMSAAAVANARWIWPSELSHRGECRE